MMTNNHSRYFLKYLLKMQCLNKNVADYEREYIRQVSTNWDINPNLLLCIFLIEKMNRGNIIYRVLERLICSFDKIVTKKNPSIGPCQIKFLTARTLEVEMSDKELISKLLDKFSNIELCARLIVSFNIVPNSTLQIIKMYTTGSLNVPNYSWIILYNELVEWGIENNLIDL